MRYSLILSVAFSLFLLLNPTAKAADDAGQINVYMYSEYIDPDLVTAFEAQTRLKVRINVYENAEEMLAKVRQPGGAKQYDVIVASNEVVPALIKLKLIQPIDKTKVPNAANVDTPFVNPPYDPDCKHSLPYQWGTVGLMYVKDKVPAGEPSWALVLDPTQHPGPIVLIDSIRDMMGVALKYQGKSVNSRSLEEVKAAGALIAKAKASNKCLGFEGGVGGKNKVLAGEAVAAIAYNGDAVRGMAENPAVNYVVPKEGGILWVDVMTISAQAPNLDGAHRFINFILDADNGAKLSDFNCYATPNKLSAAKVKEEDRKNPAIYPSAEIMAKLEYLNDLGAETTLYDEVWTAVKAR